jgi:hypothetical protein
MLLLIVDARLSCCVVVGVFLCLVTTELNKFYSKIELLVLYICHPHALFDYTLCL